MVDRIIRISEEMKKEISKIINFEMKDPRIPEVISIIDVNVSNDLKQAKVFVSILGGVEEKKSALDGLKRAAGFIRREVGHRMKLRFTPELHFELDNSIERGVYISKLIDKTVKHDDDVK